MNHEYHQQHELERLEYELAIVQRIERGLSTVEDARYVAQCFGLTTIKEKWNAKSR